MARYFSGSTSPGLPYNIVSFESDAANTFMTTVVKIINYALMFLNGRDFSFVCVLKTSYLSSNFLC